jgi:hypothetical protein
MKGLLLVAIAFAVSTVASAEPNQQQRESCEKFAKDPAASVVMLDFKIPAASKVYSDPNSNNVIGQMVNAMVLAKQSNPRMTERELFVYGRLVCLSKY